MARPRFNALGKHFGRLRVLAFIGVDQHRQAKWLCQCDCGNTTITISTLLKSGKAQSCGCLKVEVAMRNLAIAWAVGRDYESQTKHGVSGTPEYNSWHGMIRRCTNPKHPHYHNYGGRGITVCSRWLNSVKAFIKDMGLRPVGMTLDRIDNDLGYFKKNCRWATRRTQRFNRRASRAL